MTTRRIACIWLPRLAMERWRRAAKRMRQSPLDDAPFALTREGAHGPVIHATNPVAELAGVTIGARAVDARALCPELLLAEANPAADAHEKSRIQPGLGPVSLGMDDVMRPEGLVKRVALRRGQPPGGRHQPLGVQLGQGGHHRRNLLLRLRCHHVP